jgi:hypothetical protein
VESLVNILTVELARFVMLRALGEDHGISGINIPDGASIPNAVKEVRLSPYANGTDVLVPAETDEVRRRYHVHSGSRLALRRGVGAAA